MSDRQSRRRVLQLAGVSLTTLTGGCASVADRIPSTSPNQSSGESDDSADPEPSGGDDPDDTTENEQAETDDQTEKPEIDAPSGELSDAPLPDDPDEYRYARMGTGADATATVYGNWKCPYTQAFVFERLPEIVSEFVRPGDLDLEFRSVAYRSGEPFLGADAPRATRAGLSVWHLDAESYWSYFEYAFENQASTGDEWATEEFLQRLADAAGVSSTEQFAETLSDETYEYHVEDTVTAAQEWSIHNVPRLVADGEVTAPTVDFDATIDALEAAMES